MKNILVVVGFGGPAPDFSLPRIKAVAKLHVIYSVALPPARIAIIEKLSDVVIPCEIHNEADLELAIDEAITRFGIHGVMTLDEFSIAPVSRVAMRHGLRGAGPSIPLARNKWLMRQAFERVGLNNPIFARVTSEDELISGARELNLPAVLKVTEGAVSLGHMIIDNDTDLPEIWRSVTHTIKNLAENRTVGAVDSFTNPEFILEEFIEADADDWYGEKNFGDLISVEGLVVDGQYFPIAVTSKHPMMPPFTEVGQITPSNLPLEKQLTIVEFARRAVEAQCLENCGTHTEIKLQASGGLCMVESAARLPGAVITRQILEVFGIDLIGLLASILIGEEPAIPSFQHEPVFCAAGPLGVVTLNSRGEHWHQHPKINKDLDLSRYVASEVQADVTWSASINEGDEVRRYDPKLGAMNYVAIFFFKAPHVDLLIETQRMMMDQAEKIFVEAADRKAASLLTSS